MKQMTLVDSGIDTIGGLLERRAAALRDKPAVITPRAQLSYRELDEAATHIAAHLQGQGLSQGDSVAVFLSNRIEWITGWFGIARAGMACVPVNTAYKEAFLHHALALSAVRLVITERALVAALSRVIDDLPALETVVLVDAQPEDIELADRVTVLSFEKLLQRSDAQPQVTIKPSDTAGIMLTSGTTGKSKGVAISHKMLVVGARENVESMGTGPRDRLYTCLPMFHGAAQINICLHAFYAGATMILGERFSASRFWNEIRQHNVTMFNALGSVLPALLAQPATDRDTDHQVRRVFAAPAPPDVLYPFEARFNLHIVEGYGLTEIKNVTYNPIEHRKVGSVGRPTRTTELQVQDDEGNELPPGGVGEIVYRPKEANIMFSHYVGDPESTLGTIRGLWWRTGDMGYVDADGYFYFIDRMKDALRRRGENISSYEVEAAMSSFDGIGEVAVVAAPSDVGEDEVLAVFETTGAADVDLEQLYRHCDERLPYFMVPRYFRPVTELPRTPTGKIRKAVLREEGVESSTWDSLQAGFKPTRQA